MFFIGRRPTEPPFGAVATLPRRLIEDATGDDVFRLRRDAVQAARVLQEVEPALAFRLSPDRRRAPVGSRSWLVAAAAGIVVGAVLAVVLVRTVFASPFDCHGYANGTFTCSRSHR
jgi:hypothetical protein